MKINKVYEVYGKQLDGLKAKDQKEKSNTKNIRPKNSADIEISKSAKELVRQINESKDEGFSERVEKIRQSILDGKYKVSSQVIADKILDSIELQKGSEKE